MKIQLATGYAIGILAYLEEQNGRVVNTTELAERMAISILYLAKILNLLRGAHIIESVQGCNGGYRMIRPAADITVYDVMCVMEKQGSLYPLENRRSEIRQNDILDSVKGYFETVEQLLTGLLKKMTIAEFDKKYIRHD